MDSYRNKQTAENKDLNRRNAYTLAAEFDLKKTIARSKKEQTSRFNIRPLTLIEMALLSAVFVVFGPGAAGAQTIEKKGTTPYVTHFIFRPLMTIDIPGLGTATNLEAVGTTQNMKGEKMLDKMSAHCAALSVASGDKKYIDGACVLSDSDGDKIFSTFDTRDVDKSQPEMNCGTHIITGGTGKYKGITGSEPFACITMPALAGPGGYTAMDIPHNTRVGDQVVGSFTTVSHRSAKPVL
jgi:hypothetical protein